MALEIGCDEKGNMGSEKVWDAEKMLRLYIHDYMKKKGLHDAADTFIKEANLEMYKMVDSDMGLLKEWWEIFWPQFSSKLVKEAGENSQSFAQPSVKDFQPSRQDLKLSMPDVLALLASVNKQGNTSSQHTPAGNPQHNVIPTLVTNQQMIASDGSAVVNVMEQPPASLVQTPPVINQRPGKGIMNTDTESILGKSSEHAIRKWSHEFLLAKLLPNQLPPSRSPSNLHLPITIQSPMQSTGDPRNDVVAERSDQKSNPVGENSAYPPTGVNPDFSKFLKK